MTHGKLRAVLLSLISFALLWSASPTFSQMTDTLPVEDQLAESLIGTTWSGTAFDQRFDYYFLDDHLLIYRTRNDVFSKSKWQVRNGKVAIALLNNPQFPLELDFEGELAGTRITGTAKNFVRVQGKLQTENSPWIVEKLAAPVPELVAAVPANRTTPAPLPPTKIADFEGFYSATLPKKIGQSTPTTTFELRCEAASGCTLKGSDLPAEIFDKVGPLPRGAISQARFALQYAKEHKSQGVQQEPWLSSLLDSNSEISACLDLRKAKPTYAGGDTPGLNILCRLNQNPWKEPVLLYMGTILANCGPAFCRYGILPLFKANTRLSGRTN